MAYERLLYPTAAEIPRSQVGANKFQMHLLGTSPMPIVAHRGKAQKIPQHCRPVEARTAAANAPGWGLHENRRRPERHLSTVQFQQPRVYGQSSIARACALQRVRLAVTAAYHRWHASASW